MNANWRNHVTSSPDILRGKPRLRGTRIPVAMVLGGLAEGYSREQLIEQFPDLTPDMIAACLEYAKELAECETVGT